jgi:hypothetical protein
MTTRNSNRGSGIGAGFVLVAERRLLYDSVRRLIYAGSGDRT